MKHVAPHSLRIIAFLIDTLMTVLLIMLFGWALSIAGNIPQFMSTLLNTVILLPLILAISGLVWNSWFTYEFGGSVGKIATGLQVEDSDGKRLSFKKSLWRNYLGYIVSGICLWAGFIWIFFDKDHRGWHDLLADTWVVVSHKQRGVVGAIVLLVFIVVEGYMAVQIINNFKLQSDVYNSAFSDIKSTLQEKNTTYK
jgi:uncharacterized RDD family membrane protein YckC